MKLQKQALEYVAGAYVLGTLPVRARRRFEALLREDLGVRRVWLQWEERLAGLAATVPAVQPNAKTLPAILARVQPRAQHSPRTTARRWALAAALVLGVAVTWLTMRVPQELVPAYTAVVQDQSGQRLWEFAAPREAQSLELRALRAGVVPSARDYELWALLPGGAAPVSLGLVPRDGSARRELSGAQRAALLAASQLAISDEPIGGSPTGAPTGAVLYVVDLVRAAPG
jgi:anti-sigma-K factor RskA